MAKKSKIHRNEQRKKIAKYAERRRVEGDD